MKVTPRSTQLRSLLARKSLIRVLEAHNGLTGLIAENTKVKQGKTWVEFDAMWESSLTDSFSKGKPDNALVDTASRLQSIEQILEVTHKPLVVDGDDGGSVERFIDMVRSLEDLGAAAVFIEDKTGPKINSLSASAMLQEQDTVENFSKKVAAAKQAQKTRDFMIFTRIESLILHKGIDDALLRARAYIAAGADGIMIHSKEKNPDQILEFASRYHRFAKGTPLAVVPTTYNGVTEDTLAAAGISMVIYANQLMRSAYVAMAETAETILRHGRALETEKNCLPIPDMLELVSNG